jgi:hypothetical protein
MLGWLPAIPRYATAQIMQPIITGGARFDWYVDPVSGNDASSGKTRAGALQTEAGLLAKSPAASDRIGYVLQSGAVIEVGPVLATHQFSLATEPLLTGKTPLIVNPDSGDDGNDGLTYASAIKTMTEAVDRLNAANSVNLVVFDLRDHAGPWYVDKNFVLSQALTSGCRVTGIGPSFTGRDGGTANRARLCGATPVVNADATQVGATPVYYWTVTDQDCTAWEDNKLLEHKPGANWAAVEAAVTAQEGSFFHDAAANRLYIHPIGDTNPTTDGKLYLHSRYWGAGHPNLFTVSGTNIVCDHLTVSHSDITIQATGLTEGAYTFSCANVAGVWDVHDIEAYYGGYHVAGCVSGSAGNNHVMNMRDCVFEQAHQNDSATAYVIFTNSGNTGFVHNYRRISCANTNMLFRSADGTTPDGGEFLLIHGSQTFSSLSFSDCWAPRGSYSWNSNTSFTAPVYLHRCRLGTAAGYGTLTNCTLDKRPPMAGAGIAIACKESVIHPSLLNSGLSGGVTISNCLIDMRGLTAATTASFLYSRSAVVVFGVTGATFIGHPSAVNITTGMVPASDTIDLRNNVYVIQDGDSLHTDWDAASGACRDLEWMQLLGYETGSRIRESGSAAPAASRDWDSDSGVVDSGLGTAVSWTESVGSLAVTAPATATRRPAILSNDVNGHAALQFVNTSGQNQTMSSASAAVSNTDLFHAIAVVSISGNGDTFVVGGYTTPGSGYAPWAGGQPTATYRPSSSSTTATGSGGYSSGYEVLEYQVCATSVRLWRNGAMVAMKQLNSLTKPAAALNLVLGSNTMNGKIAKLVFREAGVERSHRATIRAAVAAKYGISLAG